MGLWLKDIDSSDKDQEELGKLINREWDKAEEQKVVFTVEDCRAIAHKHWERVRQNNLTMSKTQNVNSAVKDDDKLKEKKEKNKAKKAKRAAKKKEEQANLAKQEEKAGEKH